MAVKLCVFDAYGTLFDVAAAAREAATEPGNEMIADIWPALAETWRQKQLTYSWLRTAAGIHTDFWAVTGQALDYALEAHGVSEARLRERLMQLYWELTAFPEVPDTLRALRAAGFGTSVLSNASPDMLRAAITSAGLGGLLDAALSAEAVGVFKPDPRVYGLVEASFGVPRREVLFVSSNGWDAWAATAYGFRTVWVNRKGEPVDRLTTPPDAIRRDLSELSDLVVGL